MYAYTARLNSPVLGNIPTLDALLINRLTVNKQQDWRKSLTECPIKSSHELFHCSTGLVENALPLKITYVASLHAKHSLNLNAVELNNKGRHKPIDGARNKTFGDSMDTYTGLSGNSITWFFDGDPDQVFELMSGILFVGKKHSTGYGELYEREIIKAKVSHLGLNAEPLRPIPVAVFKYTNEIIVDATWKPAYWDFDNSEDCVVLEQNFDTEKLEALFNV